MKLRKAFVIVFGNAIALGSLGGLIGLVIGAFAPGYYRAVFHDGDAPDFNPVQVGFGLGVTQGLFGGIVIGIIMLFAMTWAAARARPCDEQPGLPRRRLPFLFGLSVGFVLAVVVGAAAFVIGAIAGEQGAHDRRIARAADKLGPLLRQPEFNRLHMDRTSRSLYLEGSVADQAALDRFHEELRMMFGCEEADFMARHVRIERP